MINKIDLKELKLLFKDNKCVLIEDFDNAIIGIKEGFHKAAVYDTYLCINILIEKGMNQEQATDYFYKKVVDHHVGFYCPIFIKTI